MSYKDDSKRAEIIRGEFKDHVAKFTRGEMPIGPQFNKIEALEWAQPGTGINRVVYLILGRMLIVYGDLGDAIYLWGGDGVTWDFLAGCDLDYFAQKCQASENGRTAREWDPEYAKHHFYGHFRELYELTDKQIDKLINEHGIHFDKHDWYGFLHREGLNLRFGKKLIDLCEIGSIGERVSWRTQMHLIGLKMAVEQRAKEKAA